MMKYCKGRKQYVEVFFRSKLDGTTEIMSLMIANGKYYGISNVNKGKEIINKENGKVVECFDVSLSDYEDQKTKLYRQEDGRWFVEMKN